MRAIVVSLGVLCSLPAAHAATEANRPSMSCADIRARIAAQTGILAKPDMAMVETVGSRPDCRFTSAEVFRAAYGERPIPEGGRRHDRRRDRHHHDDDD